MKINRLSAAAVAVAVSLSLAACGGSSDEASAVKGVAEDILKMPAIVDTDGLVLDD